MSDVRKYVKIPIWYVMWLENYAIRVNQKKIKPDRKFVEFMAHVATGEPA